MEWWFTADQHFDHVRIMKYCERPWDDVEDMNQALIDNWNEVVDPDDTVVVIGDVTLHSNPELVRYRFLRHLVGNKIFVKGNHDHWLRGAEKRYMYIHKCNGQMIHCSHYPLRTWAAPNRQACWQLHAHTHAELEPYENQYDVGVDNNHYYPVSLTALREIITPSNAAGEGRSGFDGR
jgi:calcineurin-like phosphoesterase family protein